LKPENVLFARAGSIQENVLTLADFGLAGKSQADALSSLVGCVGSLHYSAPEVSEVFWGHYGVECDLWSGKVLLFVCLSGTFHLDRRASQQISQPKVWFQAQEKNACSEPAKELVTTLLEPEASFRLTATAASQNVWFHNQLQDKHCGKVCQESDSDASTECFDSE
jgi:serine/threonine protein kinase